MNRYVFSSASHRSARIERTMYAQRRAFLEEGADSTTFDAPPVAGKWPPLVSIAFIVATSAALWTGVIAVATRLH